MLDQILIGIVLAFISGVSWFAYKHPLAYKKTWPLLFIFTICPAVGYMFSLLTEPYFTLSGNLKYMLTENQSELILKIDDLKKMVQSLKSFLLWDLF